MGRYSYSFFLVHYIEVHGWGAWLTTIVPASDRLAYSAAYLAGAFFLSLLAARVLWSVAERFYFRARSPAAAR
jgi:peptidoglycan/LPS O-acetylase OafA/YrhL